MASTTTKLPDNLVAKRDEIYKKYTIKYDSFGNSLTPEDILRAYEMYGDELVIIPFPNPKDFKGDKSVYYLKSAIFVDGKVRYPSTYKLNLMQNKWIDDKEAVDSDLTKKKATGLYHVVNKPEGYMTLKEKPEGYDNALLDRSTLSEDLQEQFRRYDNMKNKRVSMKRFDELNTLMQRDPQEVDTEEYNSLKENEELFDQYKKYDVIMSLKYLCDAYKLRLIEMKKVGVPKVAPQQYKDFLKFFKTFGDNQIITMVKVSKRKEEESVDQLANTGNTEDVEEEGVEEDTGNYILNIKFNLNKVDDLVPTIKEKLVDQNHVIVDKLTGKPKAYLHNGKQVDQMNIKEIIKPGTLVTYESDISINVSKFGISVKNQFGYNPATVWFDSSKAGQSKVDQSIDTYQKLGLNLNVATEEEVTEAIPVKPVVNNATTVVMDTSDDVVKDLNSLSV